MNPFLHASISQGAVRRLVAPILQSRPPLPPFRQDERLRDLHDRSGDGVEARSGEQIVEHCHPHDEPERTWVVTSDAPESATRGSISTPRFIGPG